jgi:phenylpyruvate tautomerase PptA (4-oxalocrotonate tautomerase family)
MPILDIEIVASDLTPNPSAGSGHSLPANLAQLLADETAQIFDAPVGTVWVKLQVIPSAAYAENGRIPGNTYPVFVTVLKSRVQKGGELEDEVARLTQVIAKILSRPEENVHIFYQPDGVGRVAFGGKLVS